KRYLELILQAKKAEKQTKLQQRTLQRFAFLNIDSVKKLIARSEGNVRYDLPADELYDVIDAAQWLSPMEIVIE
ncbi:hypothetical protein ILUMI_18003, partial [Ignelater luminosus]